MQQFGWAALKPVEGTVLDSLLDTAGLEPDRRADLLARMAEPGRHYHTATHLAELWTWHCQLYRAAGFDAAMDAQLVACAIAYHDAVFVPGADDNEDLSAALWRQVAPATLQLAQVEWVADTILCTARHLSELPAEQLGTGGATPGLRQWVIDLDLMPLSETPRRFRENAAMLKAEWTDGDADAAERKQRAFLRELKAAPCIYRTTLLRRTFEPTARANIAAALAASP